LNQVHKRQMPLYWQFTFDCASSRP
jgi:hypothetical protein